MSEKRKPGERHSIPMMNECLNHFTHLKPTVLIGFINPNHLPFASQKNRNAFTDCGFCYLRVAIVLPHFCKTMRCR